MQKVLLLLYRFCISSLYKRHSQNLYPRWNVIVDNIISLWDFYSDGSYYYYMYLDGLDEDIVYRYRLFMTFYFLYLIGGFTKNYKKTFLTADFFYFLLFWRNVMSYIIPYYSTMGLIVGYRLVTRKYAFFIWGPFLKSLMFPVIRKYTKTLKKPRKKKTKIKKKLKWIWRWVLKGWEKPKKIQWLRIKKKFKTSLFRLGKSLRKVKVFLFTKKKYVFFKIFNSTAHFLHKNFKFFFLRKQRYFNKGRYSRNRQLYRSGVLWCLNVNIIAVLGLNFLFYKFVIKYTYFWWYIFICLFYPIVLQFFKNVRL